MGREGDGDAGARRGSCSQAWGTQGGSGIVFGVQPLLLMAGPALLSAPLWLLSLADGSAIFRGCFRQPDNVSIALPVSQLMLNMSVDKCVDFCTEKVPGGGGCRSKA